MSGLFDAAWVAAEYLFVLLASVVLTGIGIHFERAAAATMATAPEVAAVDAVLGAVALFWGVYLVGYRQALPRMRHVLASR
ncbi:hypothetical protein [Halobaculum roseum]|uniref:DUF8151 domain-containing protein n=1 Tax=Halobaculum roseum TaxID=2175149 RepID=A0ABD5MND2_9EURY|nr:hypothetical protein [Halobaculum roseum]QZY01690.1 hypothetical protein K6T36_10140 [Halobaculum roseum]